MNIPLYKLIDSETPERGTCLSKRDRFPGCCETCINGREICIDGIRYPLQIEKHDLPDYNLPKNIPSIRLGPQYLNMPWEEYETVAISLHTFSRHLPPVVKKRLREVHDLKFIIGMPKNIRIMWIFSGRDSIMREVALNPDKLYDHFSPRTGDILGVPSLPVYSGRLKQPKFVRTGIIKEYLNCASEFVKKYQLQFFLIAPIEGIDEDEISTCIEGLAFIGLKWVYYWVPTNEPRSTLEFIRQKTSEHNLKLMLFRKSQNPNTRKLADSFSSQCIYRKNYFDKIPGFQTALFGGEGLCQEKPEKLMIQDTE